jgi:hypothetical protein
MSRRKAAPELSEVEQAAARFWAEVAQYEADVDADLKARGIDPNGPESHAYFLELEELRGAR